VSNPQGTVSLFDPDVAQESGPSQPKAAGYIRVSTQEQAENGLGLEVQRQAIERYCADHGLDLVQVYEDAGVSGTRADRAGWGALLIDMERKDFQVLLVLRLDRLARDAALNEFMAMDVEKAGVELVSVMEPSISTKGEEAGFIRRILSNLAQYEKERLVARLKAARRVKRAQGGYGGGWLAYGYGIEGEGRDAKVVTIPEEADVVRAIYEAALAGISRNRIAKRLRNKGIPTRRGGRWAAQTICTIIANPQYKGQTKTGETNGHPAIVDESTWEMAQ